MCRRVVLVGTDVWEDRIASIFRLKTNNVDNFTLKLEAIRSSEMSVPIRTTRRYIPEDDILHSHRRGNFKPYVLLK
jgi:hypothetical protein